MDLEVLLQVISILMGVIAVALPFAITIVGVWYVRDFRGRIDNLNTQYFDVMEIVDVLSNDEDAPHDLPEQDRPVVAGVLRREFERLQNTARRLLGGIVTVGVLSLAALLVAVLR